MDASQPSSLGEAPLELQALGMSSGASSLAEATASEPPSEVPSFVEAAALGLSSEALSFVEAALLDLHALGLSFEVVHLEALAALEVVPLVAQWMLGRKRQVSQLLLPQAHHNQLPLPGILPILISAYTTIYQAHALIAKIPCSASC